MHAYRRFVEQQMNLPERQWKPADLARRSGLSPQLVSNILTDNRPVLPRRPEPRTVAGLARAFGGGKRTERLIWLRVAEAMGLPVGSEVEVIDAAALSNDELIRELGRRLNAEQPRHLRAARTPRQDPDTPIG